MQAPTLSRRQLQELAEELEFWRDFASWWQLRHDSPLDDRIVQALHDAEQRLAQQRPEPTGSPHLSLVSSNRD